MKVFRTWPFKIILALVFIGLIFHGIKQFDHVYTRMESSTL